MTLPERISAFCELGRFFREYTDGHVPAGLKGFASELNQLISEYRHKNAWFTEDHIMYAITNWGNLLTCDHLREFLAGHNLPESSRTVALVMPGNIPMVGFHDFLSILISGHKVIVKPSSKDPDLPVFMSRILCHIEPEFEKSISFTTDPLKGFDALIVTGSNETARYFEEYCSAYPHIIRKNRTSVAVLTGEETPEELEALSEDIFRYFGLGCRNATKIFVPDNYQFDELYNALVKWQWMSTHNKWANNYDYHKSVYLMNRIDFSDGGFFILKKDEGFFPPLSVIFYNHYSDICILAAELKEMEQQLQCIVSKSNLVTNAIQPGTSQLPSLSDYADGVNTLRFLCNL
jgi:hypothetical protein